MRKLQGVRVPDGEQDAITHEQWGWARTVWDYLLMGHEPRACSAAIGLGSHDLGVATRTAELYGAGLFPVVVFSGGNSPTTLARFPRGEAVHYREHALALGVPDQAILLEPDSANTGENITFSRRVLAAAGVMPESVLLVSKPYMERRSFATAGKLWPRVEFVCASERVEFDAYVKGIGDEKMVIDMVVGDLQRVIEYPKLGFALEQDVPQAVAAAYASLVRDGFTSRLIASRAV
ncbi:YdcF family protein [Actinacidiphila bryophytorum]|uniref:YdcF family protein n=1 Tax=Actinacidiphila bryophytorum TaxID=1436133 RepID=UPI002176A785|nr:YdcF family protein [Actinacidiphila bryophytorum]UWE12960.1 YdcF family protein [Actinacidiphila bryophytorum]